MKNEDVILIQRILSEDEVAFAELVKKYQKAVHTLAWRKIGDFHIAEDITQDAFLNVYQKLHTLKDPNQFAGWLYVITTNLCSTWLRKKRIQTERLEDEGTTMAQRDVYSEHVTKEYTRTAVETQREVVKKLLAKLKESERTVMSLHYLGEMKVEEISRFLGVSTSTIKSRLRRARNRLQKEETVIRKALEHFQLSPNLTDNILREVSRLKPIPTPTASKPFVPWAIAATSAVLIVLLLGIGSQHLVRFQQPYTLDAQADMTVEIVDTPIVFSLNSEPNVRNQLGNSIALGISENGGQKPDEVLFASAESEEDEVSTTKQQWIQRNAPVGSGHLITLFRSQEGEIFIGNSEGRSTIIYRLSVDGTDWQPVFDINLLETHPYDRFAMAESNHTFYIVATHDSNKLYGSTDRGETWVSIGECPDGWIAEFEVIDDVFYLAYENEIHVSKDTGKTWTILNEGLIGEVNTLKVIQNTLYAASNIGLYQIDGDCLQRLQFPIAEAKAIVSFAGTEDKFYVLTTWDWKNVGPQGGTWWLFRSTDKGQSWTDITPTNALPIMGDEPFEDLPQATLVAVKNTVLLIGWSGAAVVRSVDNGNTWALEKTSNISLMPYSVHNAVAVDENTFYLQGHSGMYQSSDGGISWTRFNPEMTSNIIDVICVKTNREQDTSGSLYAMFTGGMWDTWVFKTSDEGKSWRVVNPDVREQEHIPSFTRIEEFGGTLYAKGQGPTNWAHIGLYKISENRNMLVPINGIPGFNSSTLSHLLHTKRGPDFDLTYEEFAEQLQESCAGSAQFFKQLARTNPRGGDDVFNISGLRGSGLRGAFAVSGDTFYMEHNYKLFRCELGDTEWSDTGQEETIRLTWDIIKKDLKLAVSGDTVYVGKRDGHLVVSLDRGNNWIDLTSTLPFPVKTFNDIEIVDTKVFIATDVGVAASDRGNNWGVITDSEGTNLIMEQLTADGETLYGVTKDTGIYRLENGAWNQIVSDIPEKITSLAVDGNTIYVGTQDQGMMHFSLAE